MLLEIFGAAVYTAAVAYVSAASARLGYVLRSDAPSVMENDILRREIDALRDDLSRADRVVLSRDITIAELKAGRQAQPRNRFGRFVKEDAFAGRQEGMAA